MIHFTDPHLTVHIGDCREVLATLPERSVHTVVTSPPYWGLRDYGVGGQLGLEPTPEEYVANMVAVFREVRRVLRDDGTVWLNLGDSYAAGGGDTKAGFNERYKGKAFATDKQSETPYATAPKVTGLKPKDLVGIPWRVAFALQADGWYLRSDIIWSKPNPMPESVTDRPTKAHEYVFLLSKSAKYYYDSDAVREEQTGGTNGWTKPPEGAKSLARPDQFGAKPNAFHAYIPTNGRNLRSVWQIATQPYPGAHFATFPEALVEPCVKAGTSERGVCPECGAPWVREVVVRPEYVEWAKTQRYYGEGGKGSAFREAKTNSAVAPVKSDTIGWRPGCAHVAAPVPATVLDPFGGSGTTARVANRLGRRAILIDLSADYIDQAMARNAQAPLGMIG